MESIPVRRCLKCGLKKPLSLDYFYRCSRGKCGGFRTQCKACYNESGQKYREAHLTSEARAETNRRWRAKHPERTLALRKSSRHKRRALEKNAEGFFTAEEWLEKMSLYDGRCHWCSEIIHGTPHADHVVPLSRGGTNYIENLVPSCARCNLSKGSKTVDEWQ